ncbi:MAG TPA: phosphatidate cytidylyltransferase, partial [Candidatus Binataceae bacterium]|nr:phosphatidate cytidylyltransferase [Candidatus Binataceae bacterium]
MPINLPNAFVLKTRILTSAVALPAVLAILILAPDWFFSLFIAVLGCFGLYEVAAMTALEEPLEIGMFVVVGAVMLFGGLYGTNPGWLIPLEVIVVMLLLVAKVATGTRPEWLLGWRLALIGAVYVGVLFPYFAILRNGAHGVELIVFMLLLVVASDSGAYFSGMYFGQTKLIPEVSPKKTVEGAVGGLAAAVVAGLILKHWLLSDATIGGTVCVSAVIAIFSQFGDLAGSAFKRTAGVKDSGWLFPGHGGLLDRTASLVFAVVFTYYYSR